MAEKEVERVIVTPAAAGLIGKLKAEHGALIFHQSGGCCDGSAPMCFAAGEFMVGSSDVKLGTIADAPVLYERIAIRILAEHAIDHRCRAGYWRDVFTGRADRDAVFDTLTALRR
jgi:uncharacterized protein (DUF779 family)